MRNISKKYLYPFQSSKKLFLTQNSGQHKQLLLEASLPNSKKEAYEKTIATLSSTALLKHQGDITLKDVVTEPQEILALFASKKQQDKGESRFLTMGCF